MRSPPNAKCLLLELPVELRLLIYDYALFSADHVTIASGLKCSFASPVDSGYESDDGRDSDELIPGLPPDCEPVVLPRFDPDFLHIEQPPIFDNCHAQDGAPAAAEDPVARYRANLPFGTPLALLQTSRQIKDELTWHLKSQRTQERKLSLYMTYPYGLLVFQHLCPDLIRLVRSIHISGYYYPPHAQEQVKRAVECRWLQRLYTQPPPIDESVIKSANSALKKLTRTILSQSPKAPMEELEMRIYHPGPKGNELIWRGDGPSSPICVALCNTHGGSIESSVTQGGRGAGAWLKITPNEEARTLTQRWKRFGDGNSKQECEGWVVNPEWPLPPPAPASAPASSASSPAEPASPGNESSS
ncbi:hypothetical protein MPH_01643 [Macrophomina phaseolina MS6]|uniref:Uncharacterized protein n=2 Tax=Macrophomina phaseolina TaxID=35725 RepID=K2SF15_MACPH|nr:hypothetical protein MPH_01643 [Macrophomina phaseolina MS6]KAH7058932.1 hypothetical protein B0J12DRAFT_651972 [Macrophomina phaseolina]